MREIVCSRASSSDGTLGCKFRGEGVTASFWDFFFDERFFLVGVGIVAKSKTTDLAKPSREIADYVSGSCRCY